VIPIWTVARNVSGDSLSRIATTPPAARTDASRLMRAETRAISEAAKKPFRRMATAISTSSSDTLSISTPHRH
jgi:hypothetical protein